MSGQTKDSPGQLTIGDVERVAMLARLALTPVQLETMRADLASILSHVAALNELDTSMTTGEMSAHTLETIMSDDVVVAGLPMEGVLRNATSVVEDQFLVPPVFTDQ